MSCKDAGSYELLMRWLESYLLWLSGAVCLACLNTINGYSDSQPGYRSQALHQTTNQE